MSFKSLRYIVAMAMPVNTADLLSRSPAPEFEFDADHFYFPVRLPVHSQEKQTGPVTPQVAPQVAPQVGKLVAALYGEMTAAEVMKAVGINDRVHFRESYIQPALGSNFVEMTVPGKPTSRLQKYRLTAKGRAWLAKNPSTAPKSV